MRAKLIQPARHANKEIKKHEEKVNDSVQAQPKLFYL